MWRLTACFAALLAMGCSKSENPKSTECAKASDVKKLTEITARHDEVLKRHDRELVAVNLDDSKSRLNRLLDGLEPSRPPLPGGDSVRSGTSISHNSAPTSGDKHPASPPHASHPGPVVVQQTNTAPLPLTAENLPDILDKALDQRERKQADARDRIRAEQELDERLRNVEEECKNVAETIDQLNDPRNRDLHQMVKALLSAARVEKILRPNFPKMSEHELQKFYLKFHEGRLKSSYSGFYDYDIIELQSDSVFARVEIWVWYQKRTCWFNILEAGWLHKGGKEQPVSTIVPSDFVPIREREVIVKPAGPVFPNPRVHITD